ncbi:MAG: YebG family protein [Sedimenticola sp.]
MAVIPMWMCDRDESMHDSKKEADAHDKMLELAEQFTLLLEEHVKNINEKEAEEFGLLLARNKEQLILACKGKPEVLTQLNESGEGNVTPIKATAK